MGRRALVAALVAVTAGLALAGIGAATNSPDLTATLTGKAEKPKGDLNGSGIAIVDLSGGKRTVCWEFRNIKNIAKPTAAHIHKGGPGVAGPVVVPFGGAYKAKGCISSTKAVIEAIEAHPGRYYVNIHNAAFPGGAIRGQLAAR